MKNKCPVCLTSSLKTPYSRYNHDVCRNCGVEFGYDDVVHVSHCTSKENREEEISLLVAERHKKLRQIWKDAGSLSWWEETKNPDFVSGVIWFDDYWKNNPEEYEQWENDLTNYTFPESEK